MTTPDFLAKRFSKTLDCSSKTDTMKEMKEEEKPRRMTLDEMADMVGKAGEEALRKVQAEAVLKQQNGSSKKEELSSNATAKKES
jgi:hypothetical protein